MSDPSTPLELRNPLVLATIAAVSLGAALIVHKYSGPVAAWVVGVPAVAAFGRILPYTARALHAIGQVAYSDVSRWLSKIRNVGRTERTETDQTEGDR